ncbi:MAG: DUF4189 domain-containing protein [Pseudomonadota bacterium]
MGFRLGSLAVVAWSLFQMTAAAFVVYGPEDAKDAIDNLERAPRWATTKKSFLVSGERGLGGGLEYAIDDSLCRLTFSDGSSCEQVKWAVGQAFSLWGTGHPDITFVDVTGEVLPAYPDALVADQHIGAEIDLFAADRTDFDVFGDGSVTGHTVFFERKDSLIELTNGEMVSRPIGRIESADVRINRELCYYINIRHADPGCVHFPSVVLHEVSHVLGIGHPEEAPHLNLDSDQIVGNEISIGCLNPTATLRQSSAVDGAAVSHGHDVQGHGRFVRGLTWDDVAARDALYPNCDIKRRPRFSRQWGAFALGQDGSQGQARLFRSEAAAGKEALTDCQKSGTVCQVMQTFDNCFALAVSHDGAMGMATSARTDLARSLALQKCSSDSDACTLKADFCAFEIERR